MYHMCSVWLNMLDKKYSRKGQIHPKKKKTKLTIKFINFSIVNLQYKETDSRVTSNFKGNIWKQQIYFLFDFLKFYGGTSVTVHVSVLNSQKPSWLGRGGGEGSVDVFWINTIYRESLQIIKSCKLSSNKQGNGVQCPCHKQFWLPHTFLNELCNI